MSFFEFLAQEKRDQDEGFKTASAEASQEAEDRYGSLLGAYGPNGFGLVKDDFLSMISSIALAHGVQDRVEAIQKAAFWGLTNPLMPDDRRHWTQDQWDQHFHNLGEQRVEHGPVTHLPESPINEFAIPRPGLDHLDPNDYLNGPPRQLPAVIPRAAAKSDDGGGPVPKMDKRLWTPKNVKPIKADDPKGKNPSKMVDPSVPVIKRNADELEDIGEATTERYDLNKDKQKL